MVRHGDGLSVGNEGERGVQDEEAKAEGLRQPEERERKTVDTV